MRRKIELIAALLVFLAVIVACLFVGLKKGTKIEEIEMGNFTNGFEQFASKKEEEPITIQIEGKKRNASLSIGVLTFHEALDFCEKRNKSMPNDVFEIAEEGIGFSFFFHFFLFRKNGKTKKVDKRFFDHEIANDILLWINASFSVANYSLKAQVKARPSLNSLLEKTWLEFLEKPLWIGQLYGTSKQSCKN